MTKPSLAVPHGGGCPNSNVFSGIEFYQGGSYPKKYDGAVFMADVYDGCMWWMKAGPSGDPKPKMFKLFATGIDPVDIKVGPGGDLFYVDWFNGQVRRISYTG